MSRPNMITAKGCVRIFQRVASVSFAVQWEPLLACFTTRFQHRIFGKRSEIVRRLSMGQN